MKSRLSPDLDRRPQLNPMLLTSTNHFAQTSIKHTVCAHQKYLPRSTLSTFHRTVVVSEKPPSLIRESKKAKAYGYSKLISGKYQQLPMCIRQLGDLYYRPPPQKKSRRFEADTAFIYDEARPTARYNSSVTVDSSTDQPAVPALPHNGSTPLRFSRAKPFWGIYKIFDWLWRFHCLMKTNMPCR